MPYLFGKNHLLYIAVNISVILQVQEDCSEGLLHNNENIMIWEFKYYKNSKDNSHQKSVQGDVELGRKTQDR